MTSEEIIRLARGVGIHRFKVKYLERFVASVEAAVEERLKWDGLHSCHPDCQRPACVHTRKAVEAEREACAKICDEKAEEWREMRGWLDDFSNEIAAAIRARGRE